MRRFPFYAYPNLPHSFYASPAEASHHRPHHHSSPAPPSASSRRSVVNVPVFDSTPSQSTSSPPQPHPPAVLRIDPSSAATRIQAHFRGFCVRKYRPLVHLRSIAKARKQLGELRTELEGPGFALKVKTSEKERLRFSENVMAILFRLDAVEGSMAEVRSQRKEATKMAVKLQDALDAIVMQKDEIEVLDPTVDDGGIAPKVNSVLFEQSQEPLSHQVNMVQGELCTISEGDITDVNQTQEKTPSPEDDSADNCMPNIDDNDVMDMVDENAPPSHLVGESSGQLTEIGSGCFEAVPQSQSVKAMNNAEDMSLITGDHAGSDAAQAAEEEVNDGIDALHLEAHENHLPNDGLVIKADRDSNVNDMTLESHSAMARESTDWLLNTCMGVVQKGQEGLSQDVELCPGTPTAQETGDHLHYRKNSPHENQLQGPQIVLESPTGSNCSSDRNGSLLQRHEYEEHSNEPPENPSNEAKNCNDVKAPAHIVSVAETPCLQDSAILHQLSEDCKHLKSLVGKLLVQNRAQSNILCALSERLEMLEHQRQFNCQQNLRKAREKRKLKKGSKRSVKCRNYEW